MILYFKNLTAQMLINAIHPTKSSDKNDARNMKHCHTYHLHDSVTRA